MMKRQGDLLIIKIPAIPALAVQQQSKVLAEGEATGHFHKLDSGEVYEENGTLYFKVDNNSTTALEHPEHATITFDPGVYKVIRQREYEPNGWRQVSD